MAVNRDRDAFVPAEGAEDNGSEEPGSRGSPGIGAEPRGVSGVVGHGGEESDGRAVRAQVRREQRRSTILAAATRVFRDKGYHAASVNDIIDAAQIARGTFYLYFTSKREIFAELTATFLGLIRGSVQKISLDPADGEPLTQMRANFRRVMHTVLEHGDLATIMLRGDSGDDEARAQQDLFYRQVAELVGQAIRVGHALGFARDCNVHIIAVAAVAGLKEVLGRMLVARQGAPEVVAPEVVASEVVAPEVVAPEVAVLAAEDRGDAVGGAREDAVSSTSGTAAPTQRAGSGPVSLAGISGAGDLSGSGSPWLMPLEHLADELVTFFVRGVFTEDLR